MEAGIEELFTLVLSRIALGDGFFAWPDRDRERFLTLARKATTQDPEWTARFLRWLRASTPLRIPAIVGACAFVRERRERGQDGMSRQVVGSVLQRADDPGHLIAHWRHLYGRAMPKPVKRGLADAVVRLYDEDALARYDTGGLHLNLPPDAEAPRPFRFGDVLRLVHPTPKDAAQADVFRHALDGHQRPQDTRAEHSRRAQAPIVRGQCPSEPPLEDVLRSLRRFDREGTRFEEAMEIAERLRDPAEIEASGLGPLAFLAARRAVDTARWNVLLEDAATQSLKRFPEIPGWTLILIGGGTATSRAFGLSLARICAHADVIDHEGRPFDLLDGESPLHDLHRWPPTQPPPLEEAFAGHDRVVIVEEYAVMPGERDLPLGVPAYHWTSTPGIGLTGFSDEALRVIPWIEDAQHGRWPF
ncbi:hypothetical protein [Actinomadura rupiterrae]|uniref:hypothetical protein n=1 Tax=Actinomadura rupiterrae TaxID=559627 RepID=UPI0020A4C474|nr:hypothetical protein [Actinomadura rupiterrae]MCP2336262.1 hypothetical protein [Actinomadura rupiterrae]